MLEVMSRLGSQRLREIVFLVVGGSTPIGILAVNGSAFVMQHLGGFRIAIAVCALISGLSLNGFTAYAALGRAERFAPQVVGEYRVWLIAAIVAFVIVFSVLGAYWTYESMQDPRHLPNIYAVLTALWLLLLPVLMTLVARRLKNGVAPPSPARVT
jgi:hypothetical protein